MKHVKILGLAAMALMVFGAGSSSAAELYSTGVTVNAGTAFKASLDSGTSTVLGTTDEKTVVDTCTGSSIEGTVNTYSGGNVTGAISSLPLTGCSVTTDTLANGNLSITAAGTLTGSGTVITVTTSTSCRYGTGEGTTLGLLETGKLVIRTAISEQAPKSFLCPDTTKWVADYTVTNPHDLTVE